VIEKIPENERINVIVKKVSFKCLTEKTVIIGACRLADKFAQTDQNLASTTVYSLSCSWPKSDSKTQLIS